VSKSGIVKFRSAFAVLPLAVFAFGCSSASNENATSGSQADTTSTTPDFVFDGTWGYHGDGTRTPGAIANIVYDTSRLSKCRATTDGVAAWAIVAFVSADGGAAKQYPLPAVDGSAVSVPIEIPYATDMAIWFEATDDSGCTQWDSNYGNNFHFNVETPTRTVVHFNSNFTTSVQSAPGLDFPLQSGAVVDIDYDFARLPQCRSYSGNVPAWQITLFYQRNGGTPVSDDLNVAVDNNFRVQQPGHIELPAGTTSLTVWFENDDTYGCNAWDSDYGQNYTFAVHDNGPPQE
jgi:hypothetical protein